MSEPVTFTIALKQHNFDQHNVNDTAIVGSSQRYVHTFLDGTKFESGVLESIFLACRQKGAGMTIDLDNPEPFIRDTNAEVLNAFPTKKWSSVEEAKTSIGIHNADTSLATKVEYSFLDQSVDELSTKGNGGLRQIHNFVTINSVDDIQTPPDNYKADTIGEISVDNMVQQRNQHI